ncbi:helix-turn-helix domain-containing protein [Psychromonas sp. KJ10-10]|uniref:helix-turn-helix domain-containing protein n=1 Tax=Psychromonas sp. KJ10-10 TaxID=3391823 RepID=UPI0039B6651B
MYEISNYGVAHVVFILSLLLLRPRKELHEYLLISWFIFLTIPLLSRTFAPDMLDISFPIFEMHLMYPLTFGPFLWLYIKSLIGDLTKFDKQSYIHFLPFIFISLYQIIFEQKFTPPGERQDQVSILFDQFVICLNFVSVSSYSTLSILRLRKHGQQVFSHFSEITTQVNLKWLYWIIAWFLGTYIIATVTPLLSSTEIFTHSFSLTIFVFMLSFFSLQQPSLFKDIHQSKTNKKQLDITVDEKIEFNCLTETTMTSNAISAQHEPLTKKVTCQQKKSKYERSGLTESQSLRYLKKLEHHMTTDKPYLDANLTIEKLSKQLTIPRHYLTQVINEQLHKNFYLFVNEYRINNVKELINDIDNSQLTLLDIAYASGFNSKSTFNVVFKKITDMTPSQYKNKKF